MKDETTNMLRRLRPGYDTKRMRLKLDPDLADGEHWTIHDKPDSTLIELIQAWMNESAPGDEITIGIVSMSDREADELPDI
jgi:hypothetical protein